MTVSRRYWNRLAPSVRVRIGYLLAGLPLGALWLAHAGESPLQHTIRLVVLMAAVMAASTVVRWVAARRGKHLTHPPMGRFLLLKAVLLALALGAGVAAEGRLANPDVWIGIGLVAVVAIVGPLVHPWLVGATDATHTPSDQHSRPATAHAA